VEAAAESISISNSNRIPATSSSDVEGDDRFKSLLRLEEEDDD
jgi:hypothetical protein